MKKCEEKLSSPNGIVANDPSLAANVKDEFLHMDWSVSNRIFCVFLVQISLKDPSSQVY